MPSLAPSSSRYADWKAPDEDGQLLIWPDAGTLLRETRENHQRLSTSDVRIQNVPLGELRRRQRHWMGHTADDQPLVGTGHQAELYHPGVWVKAAWINPIAGRGGGQAYPSPVDPDPPKLFHVRWPGGSM